MATEAVNITADSEMAECDGDKVVTMMDVLQEQQDFEEDANAVLGASDDKNCTYSKGYIKRQAIYACLTCCIEAKTDPTKRAGVCLACSLTCHENHELVELYTKRNFRCDCGNPKFNSHPCQFTPTKTELNDENSYNQNFSGLYCTCQRPYPDPESTTEDDMIQCVICEDWLHASHLEAAVPANDQYSEMICRGCMEKNEFLHDYTRFAVINESEDVDITNGDVKSADNSLCNGNAEKLMNSDTAIDKTLNGTDVEMTGDENIEGRVKAAENKVENENKHETCEDTKQDQSNVNEGELSEHKELTSNTEIKEENKIGDISTNNEPNNSDSQSTESHLNNVQEQSEAATSEQEPVKPSDTATDDKIDSTNNELEQHNDALKEQTDKMEQNTEQTLPSEDSSNNEAKDTEKTDQLMNDLNQLTSEAPKDSTPEEKSAESTHLEGSNENDKPQESVESSKDDNSTELSTKSSEHITPDTSKFGSSDTKIDDKTDSVMDAIDELLEGTEKKQDEVDQESKDQVEESMDTQEKTNVENTEKEDNIDKAKVPDTETSTDAEMNLSTVQNESSVTENKEDDASAIDSTTKDTDEAEFKENTNETEPVVENEESHKTVDQKAPEKNTELSNGIDSKDETECTNNGVHNNDDKTNENKRKLDTDADDISSKKAKLDEECRRPRGVKRVFKGATFWPSNFRQKLCTCGECISIYKDLNVLFLTDVEDTVSFYENLGKENIAGGASQYEKGLQALSSLDRIQQINALTEYNNMRDKLLDFLKSFKDRKEIVKEEDIKAFFAGMKPRREPDGVYFCR